MDILITNLMSNYGYGLRTLFWMIMVLIFIIGVVKSLKTLIYAEEKSELVKGLSKGLSTMIAVVTISIIMMRYMTPLFTLQLIYFN